MQILSQLLPRDRGPRSDARRTRPGSSATRKGLTKLGAYLVRQMIARHMLIEVDHMSERARERVLEIASHHHYPLVSSHTGTGGSWTDGELRSLYRLGGIALGDPGPGTRARRRDPRFRGSAIRAATSGSGSEPTPADSPPCRARRLRRSGRSLIRSPATAAASSSVASEPASARSISNTDGVAHYGLFADLLDGRRRASRDGPAAMRTLFRSAEAYLQMWERARAHR